MQIESGRSGAARIVRVAGRIDSTTSPALEQELLPLLQPGDARVVLDLSGVQYVSSAGLRLVLMAAKRAKAAGGALAACGLPPSVRDVFTISGFDRIVPVLEAEAEAVAAVGG